MPLVFKRLEGRNGRIEIPFLGARIGDISHWTLQRRADVGPDAEFYDLHAVCSFSSQALFDDPDYRDRVVVTIQAGKGRAYRLDQTPGQRMALQGRVLTMERVTLWREE